jgi:hypothetical protein
MHFAAGRTSVLLQGGQDEQRSQYHYCRGLYGCRGSEGRLVRSLCDNALKLNGDYPGTLLTVDPSTGEQTVLAFSGEPTIFRFYPGIMPHKTYIDRNCLVQMTNQLE